MLLSDPLFDLAAPRATTTYSKSTFQARAPVNAIFLR
jgi:hypothetical protein